MNTITRTQVTEILNILRHSNGGASVRTDYSGRFMHGATCIGFVNDNPALVGVAVAMVLEDSDINVLELMEDAFQDDMGLEYITYFANLKVKGK